MQGGDSIAVISAGLPEISGTFGNNGTGTDSYANGSFLQTTSTSTFGFSGGDAGVFLTRKFTASLSSSIYGASTTVQPPALQLIPQIKY